MKRIWIKTLKDYNWPNLRSDLWLLMAALAQLQSNPSRKKHSNDHYRHFQCERVLIHRSPLHFNLLHLHKLFPSWFASSSKFTSLARNRRHPDKELRALPTLFNDPSQRFSWDRCIQLITTESSLIQRDIKSPWQPFSLNAFLTLHHSRNEYGASTFRQS